MKRLRFSGLTHRIGPMVLLAALLVLASGGGCAQSGSGSGGSGGMTTSTSSATTTTSTATASSSASGTGGMGGDGGSGGATATASASSSSASSSAAGTGGSGGGGGSGGQGGGFVPPVGSADYPAEMEQNNLKPSANALQMGTKGFTASIWPLGDVDVFTFDVTVPGSIVKLTISDGMGGCPAGAQTFLRLFDANGAVVASDKGGGVGGCSVLDPLSVTALQSVAVGKFYAQVESADINPIPFYVLEIQITSPACGDGLIQYNTGEQCDDGNMVGGDGCSPTCQLEGTFLTETEPNNTPGTANSINGASGIIAGITPAGDHDYFTFDVTVPGSTVTLIVGDGLGGCPTLFDSKMFLYGALDLVNPVATDDDGGVNNCSRIDPVLYPSAGNLAAGKYFVMVQYNLDANPQPFYVLSIAIAAPACGDGIVQVGEQCDDSNMVGGDGCSATCQLEGNYITETEPNDTQGTANPIGGADGIIAAINPQGDQDYFSFNVTVPGSSVFIQVTDGLNGCPQGFDSKLSLFNPAHALIGSDDNGAGVGKCSLIAPATTAAATNLAVGTYTTRVEFVGNSTQQPFYVLKIKVVPPGCGDTVIQAGEQCDDGNMVSGDGCTSTCQSEPPYEIELNNSIATATPPWPGFSNWIGAITPLMDHDYYSFTLAAAGTATLTVHTVGNTAACPGDMYAHLDDMNGIELAHDDDSGVFPCPKLTKALQPGTYYLWVQRYQDSQVIPLYQLDFSVQ